MYLRQSWIDPRLKFDPADNNNSSRLKPEDYTWTKLWIPDVFFANEKDANFHDITTPNRLMYIYSNGHVWYVSK